MTHDPPKLAVPMTAGDMKSSTFLDGTRMQLKDLESDGRKFGAAGRRGGGKEKFIKTE
jgi:hypothetical protein